MPESCKFESCGRPTHTSAGWCSGHYQQVWAGKTPTPLRRRGSPGCAATRDEHGRKFCGCCEQWYEVDEFCVSVKAADGLHGYCKSCMRAKKWRDRYGITPDEFEALRRSQNARCKLCGEHESESKQGLFVDHDHSHCSPAAGCPECVRGLLCRSCNMAIGLFRDRPELMEAAAGYVRSGGQTQDL